MAKTDINAKNHMPVFKLEIQGVYDKEKITFVSDDLEGFLLLRKKLWEAVLGSAPPSWSTKQ